MADADNQEKKELTPEEKKALKVKSATKICFFISLLANVVFVLIGCIAANMMEVRFNEGFYQGQAKVYQRMEQWGYGKFVKHDGSADFQFKEDDRTIYVYDRNQFPNVRTHPDGRPPK